MALYFLDSSALVKRYISETGSARNTQNSNQSINVPCSRARQLIKNWQRE
jgi:hypothetical protein